MNEKQESTRHQINKYTELLIVKCVFPRHLVKQNSQYIHPTSG